MRGFVLVLLAVSALLYAAPTVHAASGPTAIVVWFGTEPAGLPAFFRVSWAMASENGTGVSGSRVVGPSPVNFTGPLPQSFLGVYPTQFFRVQALNVTLPGSGGQWRLAGWVNATPGMGVMGIVAAPSSSPNATVQIMGGASPQPVEVAAVYEPVPPLSIAYTGDTSNLRLAFNVTSGRWTDSAPAWNPNTLVASFLWLHLYGFNDTKFPDYYNGAQPTRPGWLVNSSYPFLVSAISSAPRQTSLSASGLPGSSTVSCSPVSEFDPFGYYALDAVCVLKPNGVYASSAPYGVGLFKQCRNCYNFTLTATAGGDSASAVVSAWMTEGGLVSVTTVSTTTTASKSAGPTKTGSPTGSPGSFNPADPVAVSLALILYGPYLGFFFAVLLLALYARQRGRRKRREARRVAREWPTAEQPLPDSAPPAEPASAGDLEAKFEALRRRYRKEEDGGG